MKLSPKAKKSLDKVLTQFQSGDLSAITQVARIRLDESAPASKWSFSNQVLAFAQAGEMDCRGYKQWQEFGRQVTQKGAVYIFRPNTKKITDKKTGEEKYICVGFGTIPVFPASLTEGDTPLPDYTPAELPPLADVAKRLGVEVSYQPVGPDRLGDYTPGKQKIRLGVEDPSVFFHELAHAAHYRIDEDYKIGGGQDTQKETIAEFTAAVLMDLYGIRDHSGNAWKYISSYANDPLVAIQKALGIIEKVLGLLTEEEVLQ